MAGFAVYNLIVDMARVAGDGFGGDAVFFVGGDGDGSLRARRAGIVLSATNDIVASANKHTTAKDGIAADGGKFFYWCLNPPPDIAALAKLLQASPILADKLDDDCTLILPRAGRISAWGGKAADIIRRCGFGDVRIERGLLLRGGFCIAAQLADAMTESCFCRADIIDGVFCRPPPVQPGPESDLAVNTILGRAASEAESLMFAQVNSEHCRHHIFNHHSGGDDAMMTMIRQTHKHHPRGAISVFADNAAVVEGASGGDFFAGDDGVYQSANNKQYLVAKAETHNHPTAVSPFFGAATGSGGELRDEAAAGTGAAARVGFCGFAVSSLPFAHCPPPVLSPPPPRFADALRIMTEAPLGAAAYNNEFGRPAIGGFFRVYESASADTRHFGFHKPLMLAGGLGQILPASAHKQKLSPGDKIVHLGGAGLRVGMGGGAASSGGGGAQSADADFNSVQRGNAEMQRRAMEVLDTLRRRKNGALSVHDVGAGGLSCAVGELAHNAGCGAIVRLVDVPVEEDGMRPAEIWCNEAQERFVLALPPPAIKSFGELCARERCPFAVIGEITASPTLVVVDDNGDKVVDFPLDKLLGGDSKVLTATPPQARLLSPPKLQLHTCDDLRDACYAVLRHPSVASKRFLITIGDRTVGGLTARDQMVGPWQTPVADCAAFLDNYSDFSGACFALGERPGIAAVNPAAGARMAVAESLCNLAAADIGDMPIHLSLNWLADCSSGSGGLRVAVQAASAFCIGVGVGVVVGKDSLSMRMPAGKESASAPPMAVAAAFAASKDVRRILTPQLQVPAKPGEAVIMKLCPDMQNCNLGGSVFASLGGGDDDKRTADICAVSMRTFLAALAQCKKENLFLSFHDCSDGGMWAAVCEMAFAANCGLVLTADAFCAPVGDTDGDDMCADALAAGGLADIARALFAEDIATLAQVQKDNAARVLEIFAANDLTAQTIGSAQTARQVQLYRAGKVVLSESTADLRRAWQQTDSEMCLRRDNPQCAKEEAARDYDNDPGLFVRAPQNWQPQFAATAKKQKPRVAILREQGINGQREMAAAFVCAGFEAVDVHISDLQNGRRKLDAFCGAAFCGGFSFGDVLGAGRGYAGAVLGDNKLADMFAAFFARADVFSLGVCNGCQTLSHLQALLPDGACWHLPKFLPNRSGVFEARLTMTEVLPNNSPLFADMAGMILPAVSSHAEGRAVFDNENGGVDNAKVITKAKAAALMRYVDNTGKASVQYPHNPNGSEGGLCGFSSPDGRIAALMPHPERVFRRAQMSWFPADRQNDHTPWLQIFTNARKFATGA